MATYVLKDAKLWISEYDLTGHLTRMEVTHGAEPVDATVFGGDTKIFKAGLETLAFSDFGLVDMADDKQDESIRTKLTTNVIPITIAPTDGLQNSPAIFFEGKLNAYQWGGAVGVHTPFSLSGVAGGGRKIITNGLLLEDGVTAKTATGSGTGRQFAGGVASGKSLFAIFHLLTFSGAASIDVLIESDDASGFISPTTRITFANKASISSEYVVPLAGPITDDWLRVKFTFVTPTTPSAKIVVAVGIK